MFCPFCGTENRSGKKFCRQCGRTIPPPRLKAVLPAPPESHEVIAPLSMPVAPPPSVSVSPPSVQLPPTPLAPPSMQLPPTVTFTKPEPLVEESIYSNFSASAEVATPSNRAPLASNPWRSDVSAHISSDLSSSAEFKPSTEEFEEQMNQGTVQLLPDTVDFQMPRVLPTNFTYGSNGREKLANGASTSLPSARLVESPPLVASQELSLESWPPPVPGFMAEPDPDIGLPTPLLLPRVLANEKIPTGELDTMEKILDKTAEVPVLSPIPTSAPPVATMIEPAITPSQPLASINSDNNAAKASRQLLSFMPLPGATESLYFNRVRRLERIVLIIAIIIAIAGIAIVAWLWMKSLGFL
ncbi:MAG: zinc ribbon domain-containing protein [Acidobacteriota bacterium]